MRDEEESAEDLCEVCPEGVELGDVEEGDQVGQDHLGPGLLLGGSLGLTNDKVFPVHCLNFGWLRKNSLIAIVTLYECVWIH